jgi:hypothetical protein
VERLQLTPRSRSCASARVTAARKTIDTAEAYLRDMEALVRTAEARKHAACEAYAIALAELECAVDLVLVPAAIVYPKQKRAALRNKG